MNHRKLSALFCMLAAIPLIFTGCKSASGWQSLNYSPREPKNGGHSFYYTDATSTNLFYYNGKQSTQVGDKSSIVPATMYKDYLIAADQSALYVYDKSGKLVNEIKNVYTNALPQATENGYIYFMSSEAQEGSTTTSATQSTYKLMRQKFDAKDKAEQVDANAIASVVINDNTVFYMALEDSVIKLYRYDSASGKKEEVKVKGAENKAFGAISGFSDDYLSISVKGPTTTDAASADNTITTLICDYQGNVSKTLTDVANQIFIDRDTMYYTSYTTVDGSVSYSVVSAKIKESDSPKTIVEGAQLASVMGDKLQYYKLIANEAATSSESASGSEPSYSAEYYLADLDGSRAKKLLTADNYLNLYRFGSDVYYVNPDDGLLYRGNINKMEEAKSIFENQIAVLLFD